MADHSASLGAAPGLVDGSRGSALLGRRPRLVTSLVGNVAAFAVLWVAYSSVRSVTADSFATAFHNADLLVQFQHRIGLPSEATLQHLLLPYEWLVRTANVYYIGFHFPSMGLFLAWVLLGRREWMPTIRLGLLVATGTGLLIHLAYPLAPPRMLGDAGFVDTAALIGPDPYALGIAEAANELAAMPSMHVGWALFIALAVVRILDTRWRWVVVAHPVITSFVVVVTANHYWTDVVVGAALGSAGWWIACRVRPVRQAAVVAVPVLDVDRAHPPAIDTGGERLPA